MPRKRVQEIRRGIAPMPPADILDRPNRTPAVNIRASVQSIGAEQDGITRLEVEREFVVDNSTEYPGGNPASCRTLHSFPRMSKGEHAGACNAHLRTKRIKNGVLNTVSFCDAEAAAACSGGRQPGRGLAGLVDAAQCANRQRGVERRRKAFPAHVAHV